jgi:hypothetical protein
MRRASLKINFFVVLSECYRSLRKCSRPSMCHAFLALNRGMLMKQCKDAWTRERRAATERGDSFPSYMVYLMAHVKEIVERESGDAEWVKKMVKARFYHENGHKMGEEPVEATHLPPEEIER